jgi:hypothetical protein
MPMVRRCQLVTPLFSKMPKAISRPESLIDDAVQRGVGKCGISGGRSLVGLSVGSVIGQVGS